MMKRQPHVTDLLYEFVRGELPQEKAGELEAHLAVCEACHAELEIIRQAVAFLGNESVDPSMNLSEEYWRSFPLRVEERTRTSARAPFTRVSFLDAVISFLTFDRKYLYAAAISAAVVVAVLFFWPRGDHATVEKLATVPAPSSDFQVLPARDRLTQYFRKSKVLLVGITNMTPGDGQQIDLRSERKASRGLILEARYLKKQRLDLRSAKLIDDMNKILIELANMEEQADLPDVELIRSGIHQENLLFKIRIAETLSDTTHFIASNNSF